MKPRSAGIKARRAPLFFAASALLAAGEIDAADPGRGSFRVGVDANYSADMEAGGAVWTWNGSRSDLFEGMARQGVTGFRVRLWTREEGAHGKRYATDVVQRALRAGLDPYLVIFLSDDWADLMKQPVPAAWAALSFEERAAAIQAYSRDTVGHFRRAGLRNHLYEIGNEIDYGICGEYPGKGSKKNPAVLGRHVWPRSARLIRASQAGVLEADPEARFMLHIAHWWDADFCTAFFRFMLDQGVRIDCAGLSYFPSSNIGGSLDMEEFGATVSRLAAAIGRPVIVAETAYPSARDFSGQFSRWKYEVMGYPLTPEGQRRWVADFLSFCNRHPDIEAVYYWSPEWYGEGMWKAFALFDPKGDAKPAWAAFRTDAWRTRAVLEPVFVEVQSDRLFVVPLGEARKRMASVVERLRAQTGGVTVEHIALLSETELKVGAYAVDLRASLQQNLSMTLEDASAGVPVAGDDPQAVTEGLRRIVAGIDPSRQRLVLVLRGEPTPGVARAVAFFEQEGLRVDLHPRAADSPLKFGMSFQPNE